MGDFLTGVLGTGNQVQTGSAQSNIQPWQDQATALNSTLTKQSRGGGPNPAQAQYLQNTQNVAQQQAVANAQNRSINPGLAARMSGNQAVAANLQGASTAGIQQAQQQLASQQLQANLLGQQEQASNQASSIAAGIGAGNQQAAQGAVGGVLTGGGSMLMKAQGGMIHGYDVGGSVSPVGGNPMSSAVQQSSPVMGGELYQLPQNGPAQVQKGIGDLAKGAKKFYDAYKAKTAPTKTDPAQNPKPGDENPDNPSNPGSDSAGSVSEGADSVSDAGSVADAGSEVADAAADFAAKGGMILPDHLKPIAEVYHPQHLDAGGILKLAPLAMMLLASKGGEIFKENKKLSKVPQKDRFGSGGQVPAMVSSGESYLPPNDVKKVAEGKESPMDGKKIPGKASVKGDSEKNDVVPASLQEGGIVIPRSVMNSENPEEEARKFVAKELAKHRASPEGEFREALKRHVSGRKKK